MGRTRAVATRRKRSVEPEHPTVDERTDRGREARGRAALTSHAEWAPTARRPDPVALLEAQDATREADLVPVRHGRMMVSPFTFYRGAAKIMAAIWRRRRPPASTASCAATRTSRTSACSPHRSGHCSSA